MPTVSSPAARARPIAPRFRVAPAAPQAAVLRSVRRENSEADIYGDPRARSDDAAPAPFPLAFRFRKDRAARFPASTRGQPPHLLAPSPKLGRSSLAFSPTGRLGCAPRPPREERGNSPALAFGGLGCANPQGLAPTTELDPMTDTIATLLAAHAQG